MYVVDVHTMEGFDPELLQPLGLELWSHLSKTMRVEEPTLGQRCNV